MLFKALYWIYVKNFRTIFLHLSSIRLLKLLPWRFFSKTSIMRRTSLSVRPLHFYPPADSITSDGLSSSTFSSWGSYSAWLLTASSSSTSRLSCIDLLKRMCAIWAKLLSSLMGGMLVMADAEFRKTCYDVLVRGLTPGLQLLVIMYSKIGYEKLSSIKDPLIDLAFSRSRDQSKTVGIMFIQELRKN